MLFSAVDDTASYSWHHGNLKAIAEGRVLEDANHRGTLKIVDISFLDTGVYVCSVSYIDPDTYRPINDNFSHVLSVVSAPEMAVHAKIHYITSDESGCSSSNMEALMWQLPELIEKSVCAINNSKPDICSINVHNPLCHTMHKRSKNYVILNGSSSFSSNNDQAKSNHILSMIMSVSMPDIRRIIRSTEDNTLCSPECGQKLVERIAEHIKDALNEVLLIPVVKSAAKYLPDKTSISLRVTMSCAGGYELVRGFCEPCPPDHYSSDDGPSICEKCPPGYKQDVIASKNCERCIYPWTPGCLSMLLLWPQIAILSLLVLLLLFLCFSCLCCLLRRKKSGIESRKCFCTKDGSCRKCRLWSHNQEDNTGSGNQLVNKAGSSPRNSLSRKQGGDEFNNESLHKDIEDEIGNLKDAINRSEVAANYYRESNSCFMSSKRVLNANKLNNALRMRKFSPVEEQGEYDSLFHGHTEPEAPPIDFDC